MLLCDVGLHNAVGMCWAMITYACLNLLLFMSQCGKRRATETPAADSKVQPTTPQLSSSLQPLSQPQAQQQEATQSLRNIAAEPTQSVNQQAEIEKESLLEQRRECQHMLQQCQPKFNTTAAMLPAVRGSSLGRNPTGLSNVRATAVLLSNGGRATSVTLSSASQGLLHGAYDPSASYAGSTIVSTGRVDACDASSPQTRGQFTCLQQHRTGNRVDKSFKRRTSLAVSTAAAPSSTFKSIATAGRSATPATSVGTCNSTSPAAYLHASAFLVSESSSSSEESSDEESAASGLYHSENDDGRAVPQHQQVRLLFLFSISRADASYVVDACCWSLVHCEKIIWACFFLS